jgi:4-methyl-5(b-hydroxyethyl)-thiazole monophosphate biosynthesis
MAKRLLVILYNGVADWEVGFPLFCLHPRIESQFASPGEGPVRTTMGFEIRVTLNDLRRVDVGSFDGIYLPGGLDPETGRFARSLCENNEVLDILRQFSRRDKVVAAICGAPLVMGAAGLLEGRRFACDITEDTRGWFEGAVRVDEPVCTDGRILTGSVSAIIPFCRDLARLLGEPQTAEEIEAFFVR